MLEVLGWVIICLFFLLLLHCLIYLLDVAFGPRRNAIRNPFKSHFVARVSVLCGIMTGIVFSVFGISTGLLNVTDAVGLVLSLVAIGLLAIIAIVVSSLPLAMLQWVFSSFLDARPPSEDPPVTSLIQLKKIGESFRDLYRRIQDSMKEASKPPKTPPSPQPNPPCDHEATRERRDLREFHRRQGGGG